MIIQEIKDMQKAAERTQMKAFQLLDDLAKDIPDEKNLPDELASALEDLSE